MTLVPMTVEGKRKIQAELDVLTAKVPLIAKAVEEAREKGDLKENSEYHAAREEMGMNAARIAELKDQLSRSVVVDESQIDHSRIAFGATVRLKDLKDKSVEEWQLVGAGEDDALENKILTSSPMGQALLGKAKGDTIEVHAPAGLIKFKVEAISY